MGSPDSKTSCKREYSEQTVWLQADMRSPNSISSDHSRVVPLLQFCLVCAFVVSYATFILSFFIFIFSSLVPQECCTSWLWHFLSIFICFVILYPHLFFLDASGRLCFVTGISWLSSFVLSLFILICSSWVPQECCTLWLCHFLSIFIFILYPHLFFPWVPQEHCSLWLCYFLCVFI